MVQSNVILQSMQQCFVNLMTAAAATVSQRPWSPLFSDWVVNQQGTKGNRGEAFRSLQRSDPTIVFIRPSTQPIQVKNYSRKTRIKQEHYYYIS